MLKNDEKMQFKLAFYNAYFCIHSIYTIHLVSTLEN